MVLGLLEKYSDLPDNSMVTIKQVNEESIHQHNAYAEKVAEILKREMENAVSLSVPLRADVKIGKSWYETK